MSYTENLNNEPSFQKPNLHLAISGTYSTGKSTTTETLSLLSGIPRTHAMTAREILMDVVPGKQLQELNSTELIALGLRRFEERVHNEAKNDAFISDGSVIHEWVYGQARLMIGINPGAPWPLRAIRKTAGLSSERFYKRYMDSYGSIVKSRAARTYDAYVHLPVEFPLHKDGHRPVSESFRRLSDQILTETVRELKIPLYVVRGTLEERVEKITRLFNLPTVMPVEQAAKIARDRVAETIRVIEEDNRFHEAQRKKSIMKRIRYAMRY
ncbi:AAA family ATPase [Lysinibacter sp. HNR]|uniref:AAA family ATPase n=1 Tax=Lysinibacter sp. HNR TaxID=3031408 RepID=UPI00243498F6|nr:AAA family ATPase [Lysinibacter sp. HNR]WGD37207.1 AAA family ATPase [Lysinibacter sp. HNR]